jgi:hypothetical protein
LATGDPIARGNIILGADTTPLEAGLSAAKEQAKAAGEEIQQAANGAYDLVEPQGPIEIAGEKERTQAEQERLRVAKELNETIQVTEQRTEAVAKKTGGIAESIKGATAGFRGLASSITSTVGAVSALLGVVGIVGGAVLGLKAKIEDYFKRLADYANAAKKAYEDYATLVGKPLVDQEKTASQQMRQRVYDEAQRRREAIAATYKEEFAAADALSGQARENAVQNAEYARNVATERINKLERQELESIQRRLDRQKLASEQAARDAEANDARRWERIDKLREDLREKDKRDREETAAEQYEQMTALIDELVSNQRAAADDYRNAMRDATRDIAAAQSAQFAQLRSDINSLFTTANTEVGINRVADLLETLIRKTEGNR